MLLDGDGLLRIRKTYPRAALTKYTVSLITIDFAEDQFAGLPKLKERELNSLCASLDLDVTRSGRGITNRGKRDALRSRAREIGVATILEPLELATKDDLWKQLSSLLPRFVLFETDTKLGVGETTFQSQFRPVVTNAAQQAEVVHAREDFTNAIGRALQGEVDKVFARLKRHTLALTDLRAKPEFAWDKAVTFDMLGKDADGVEKSLDRRGSGMRRLLMVAFFQYLAERGREESRDYVFAVEEPENCLHPGLQRELALSFRELAKHGYQIICTSHSPVFAGSSPLDDLALVIRERGVARAIQVPVLDLAAVAEQLGVEPSDQITGYHACVFVEGPGDIDFWSAIAGKMKDSGHTQADFRDRNIGFILCGGDTLKHWINQRAMRRLNRRFGVVVDSDRASPAHNVPGRKLNWKVKCENEGGLFVILRKREIENYLHPAAIERSGRTLQRFDDFSDMKSLFGENVYRVILDMSCDEILECDAYSESGVEGHELREILHRLLSLPEAR